MLTRFFGKDCVFFQGVHQFLHTFPQTSLGTSFSEILKCLKSKDGATLRRPEDIKKRWCEHYSEFLNRHPVIDESVLDLIKQHDPIMALDEVPSRGEIKASVSQMNKNKVPGMGGITAEILKNGGEKMIDLLEQVIQSVWGK